MWDYILCFFTHVIKYSRYFEMNNSKTNPKRKPDKTNKHTDLFSLHYGKTINKSLIDSHPLFLGA